MIEMGITSRAAIFTLAVSACFLLILAASYSSADSVPATLSSSLAVSPTSGPVGTKTMVIGQGFSPDANLILYWSSANVSWVLSGNPTQVAGVSTIKTLDKLASVQSDSSGSFSLTVSIPPDNSGSHLIQAYATNGNSSLSSASFTLEPSFSISSASGPAGSPIVVTAHALGDSAYSTSYHVLWDNKYFGYMTGVTTHGEANFTFYAIGTLGIHYIDIYQGYPGPGYLNAEQIPYPSNLESYYPPLIPFHAQFTITSGQVISQSSSSPTFALPLISLGLVLSAFVLAPAMAFQSKKNGRGFSTSAMSRISVILAIAALLIAGTGAYLALGHSSTQAVTQTTTLTSTQTVTQTSTQATSATTGYTPQISVVRPTITVPQTTTTSAPRISVKPNVATVGEIVNVTGGGFAANSNIPLSWSTVHGSNIQGYQTLYQPLKNVTASAAGSFSFTMKVPVDLEGVHFIAAANNLTRNSNATLYIERNATVIPNEGPEGIQIVIQLLGTGWDYNTNIVAIDYDNAFVGYACGFSSQGNITVILTAAGSPGIHSIDLYPSIWLGPSPPNTIAEYRYPLLTPYDGPEHVPSFHFSFLITSGNATTATGAGIGNLSSVIPALMSFVSMGLATLYLTSRMPSIIPRRFARFNN